MSRSRRLLTRSGDQFDTSGEDWSDDTSYDLSNVKYVQLDEFYAVSGSFYGTMRVVVWEDGFISLGDVTQEQIDWVNSHPAGDPVFDFPGDVIYAGSVDIQQPVKVGVGFVDFDPDPVTGAYSRDDAVRVLRITWQTEDFDFLQIQFTSEDFTIIDGAGAAGIYIGDPGLDLGSYPIADFWGFGSPVVGHYLGDETANTLLGSANPDVLEGYDGNDALDGDLGDDVMIGGPGDDVYFTDFSDTVVENAGEGRDKVYAASSHELGANVEDLTLLAAAGAATGRGNDLNNVIFGNDFANVLRGMNGADILIANGGNDSLFGGNANDRLFGGAGNDGLDGNAGTDELSGGAGDDTYFVDLAGDRVIELAAEGRDKVYSVVSFTLAANVEDLTLQPAAGAANATGNGLGNVLTGNDSANILNGLAGDDTLIGNGGNDAMIGGTGADAMRGGLGDDAYYMDSAGDAVTELAGQGRDKIYADLSWTLAANVEDLVLQAAAAGSTATGNDLANVLTGNASNNVLRGLGGDDALIGNGGNDSLQGSLGRDTMQGGAGADTFWFTTALGSSNVDRILDFQAGLDKIILENSVFAGVPAGALAAAAFRTGAAAADADDRIVYNSATGALLFDSDGAGAAAAVQFATLQAGLALSASDFTVI